MQTSRSARRECTALGLETGTSTIPLNTGVNLFCFQNSDGDWASKLCQHCRVPDREAGSGRGGETTDEQRIQRGKTHSSGWRSTAPVVFVHIIVKSIFTVIVRCIFIVIVIYVSSYSQSNIFVRCHICHPSMYFHSPSCKEYEYWPKHLFSMWKKRWYFSFAIFAVHSSLQYLIPHFVSCHLFQYLSCWSWQKWPSSSSFNRFLHHQYNSLE